MKRIIAILLVLLMTLVLAACAGKPQGEELKKETPQPGATQQSGGESQEGKAGFVTDGSKLGVMQKLNEGARSKIKGLIITTDSGHHDYPTIEKLVEDGYKTEGLYSEYLLNEWFAVYADISGNSSVGVYVVPNDPAADYASMNEKEIAAIAEGLDYVIFAGTATPDTEEYGKLFSAYVNGEMDAGLYNIVFTDGGRVCMLVQLDIKPQEE